MQTLWAVLDTLHPYHQREQYCDFCELINWMRGRSLAEVWEQCPRADWLIFLCGKMAGQGGWPTEAQIVLALRALAHTSARIQLRETIEIVSKWETGEATIEQLCEAAETAVTAYARTEAHAKTAEYAGHRLYSERKSSALTCEAKALKETADILRRTLNAPYPMLKAESIEAPSQSSEGKSPSGPESDEQGAGLEDEETEDRESIESLESRLEALEGEAMGDREGKYREASGGFWVFGSALAMILSWSRNGSILYCMGHGILSWVYVIYFALTR
jgi:hypothetical protein